MMDLLSFEQHRILVTGASSGIGRATAIVLSELGASLILTGRDAERLALTAAQLTGEHHVVAPFDLTEVDEIPPWMKKLAADHGTLNGLVHAAGIQITHGLRTFKQEHMTRTMSINVDAAAGLVKGFRQRGVKGTPGAVVFMSSVAGSVGIRGSATYAASKGAIESLTRSLALELVKESIRVNAVAPGYVITEMAENLRATLGESLFADIEQKHPMGLGTAEDVAYATAFLLSPAARWITGTTLTVDGGYTCQ